MGAMTYLGNYCAKSLQGVLKIPCGFRNSRVCSNHKEDHVNEMYKKIDDCKAQNSEDSDQSQLTYFPPWLRHLERFICQPLKAYYRNRLWH